MDEPPRVDKTGEMFAPAPVIFISEFYCGQVHTRLHWIQLRSAPREVLMQNRSFTQTKPKKEYDGREMRPRVRFHGSGKDSINRRLEETGLTLSDYIRHLVQKDIGVYV